MPDEKKPKKSLRKNLTEEQKKALDAGPVERTPEQSRLALRKKVRIFYDLQRMRLQVAGRNEPKAEGAEIQLHEFDLATLNARATELYSSEKNALRDVEDHLKTIPFYVGVLSDKERFKGIGPTMAGVILSEFDIHKADTPSKFWSFAGLAPIPARRCKHCNRVVEWSDNLGIYTHAKGALWIKGVEVKCALDGQPIPTEQTYESGKSARPKRGEKLKYSSFVRAKMMGVLGPILLKCDSPWRSHYDNYKNRWITAKKGTNDAHRHQAAIRYMVKMLLAEIWGLWREHLSLPRRPSYAEEKLGMKHVGGTPQSAQKAGDDLTPEMLEEMKNAGLESPAA